MPALDPRLRGGTGRLMVKRRWECGAKQKGLAFRPSQPRHLHAGAAAAFGDFAFIIAGGVVAADQIFPLSVFGQSAADMAGVFPDDLGIMAYIFPFAGARHLGEDAACLIILAFFDPAIDHFGKAIGAACAHPQIFALIFGRFRFFIMVEIIGFGHFGGPYCGIARKAFIPSEDGKAHADPFGIMIVEHRLDETGAAHLRAVGKRPRAMRVGGGRGEDAGARQGCDGHKGD